MEPWADPDYIRDEREPRGPELADRQPRPGDTLYDRGDRLTILTFDPDTGRMAYDDPDGFRLHRARTTVWWDGEAWRCWGAGA